MTSPGMSPRELPAAATCPGARRDERAASRLRLGRLGSRRAEPGWRAHSGADRAGFDHGASVCASAELVCRGATEPIGRRGASQRQAVQPRGTALAGPLLEGTMLEGTRLEGIMPKSAMLEGRRLESPVVATRGG